MNRAIAIAAALAMTAQPGPSAPRSTRRLGHAGGTNDARLCRMPNTAAAGRNEPCPCGSGKKYKRCCRA